MDELREHLIGALIAKASWVAWDGLVDFVLSEINAAGYHIVGPLPDVSSVKSLTLYDTLWRLEGNTGPFPDDDPGKLAAFWKRLTNVLIALERAGYEVTGEPS